MPTPTTVIEFGEAATTGGLLCVVELDDQENVDQGGNQVTTFLEDETVNILVHIEPGTVIKSVSSSYGTIVNANGPVWVTRTNTIEQVTFKSEEDEHTLPHVPNGGVTPTWYGRSRTLSVDGRKITCTGGAGVCDLSYSYGAWQFHLTVPDLSLGEDDEFPVEVSFEVE